MLERWEKPHLPLHACSWPSVRPTPTRRYRRPCAVARTNKKVRHETFHFKEHPTQS